jgi:hypothetical protein
MSASGALAGIAARLGDVCFSSESRRQSGIGPRPLRAISDRGLFDHLVSRGEQRWGHRDAERLRGLEIDDEIELGRLIDRPIGGLGAAQKFEHLYVLAFWRFDLRSMTRFALPVERSI